MSTKACLHCQQTKSYQGFLKGHVVCKKCTTAFGKGKILGKSETPDPLSVPDLGKGLCLQTQSGGRGDGTPELHLDRLNLEEENINKLKTKKEKFFEDLGWCEEYYMKNREGIPKGEYIVVVYPKPEIKRYKTYEAALEEVNKLPAEVAALVTEHPIEDVGMIVGGVREL
jgi:hypothetical protein